MTPGAARGAAGARAEGEGAVIVIATYNEIESAAALLAGIHRTAPRAHVLVVDDNSPDGTGAFVEAAAKKDRRTHVLRRAGKMGYGTAVVAGLRWALDRGYPVVATMDADFSHDPSYLPAIFGALERADLAIGSRYVHGISVVNWPLWRLMLSLLGNQYARWFARLRMRDTTSGFKAFRRELLVRIPFEQIRSNGYAFIMEFNFWSHHLGGRIVEVPIIFVDRHVGVSKMGGHIIREAILTPYRLWWQWWVGKR